MRGAIASSSTLRNADRSLDNANAALAHFRLVQQIPGHLSNATAKELEAHQLRKLGHFQQALTVYTDVEALAAQIQDQTARDLATARAKRYRAEVLQTIASTLSPDGARVFQGCPAANQLLSPQIVGSALALRNLHGPYLRWELLEHADTNFLSALVCNSLGYNVMEQARLLDARNAYQDVLSAASRRRVFGAAGNERLRALARKGLARVDRAAGETVYDSSWFCSSN